MIPRRNTKVNLDQTLQDLKHHVFKSHESRHYRSFFSITKSLFVKSSSHGGTTVTSTYYKDVFELLKCIARVHLEKFRDRDYFILRDNTLVQKATIDQLFLADKRVPTI